MEYRTIADRAQAEIEISRSRFLTTLARVETEVAAREVIAEARSAHPRARHHCSAFVLGPGGRVRRSNDDGEPGGTAGAPMLDALTSAGLSDVVAVVTRYFGGVLLGAGGLTRAYRAAVARAIEAARIVTRAPRRSVLVDSGYDVAAVIEAEARRRGWTPGEAEYGEAVSRSYLVAEDQLAPLTALVAELSAGTATVAVGSTAYVDLPSG
ncbi:YigZ family protein [Leucobacter weissii]|uniref:IMPACT family protein n=1 Tax=Leucobacter weissii TaxID=1983706 RepID=UPI003132C8A3